MFASFYFTGVLAAGLGDAKLDALYVPVAGPFILLGKGSGDSDFKKVMVLDGANQVIGLGLVVAAFLVKRTLLIKDRRVMTRVYPVPKFGADGVGVSLVGQF
ncbi:MAG TPA: hypothetical protein PLR99_21760 [Polyangiaceae bacterium]|nr:hypothetical protein [Polyangiaceae bacterium]